MKYFTIIMILLFANLIPAQNNYSDRWNQVEQLEVKGLPKSALEIVEQIALDAEKDKNDPQQIKVLLFKSKYALTLEEDAQLKIINDFKSQIAQSTFPKKNILENLLATLHWQYFQQNRWRFYERTTTSKKVDATDFRTWDLQTLFDEIHQYYSNSLANGLLLQQENLIKYNEILSLQKESKLFRPSLYDLLAHNALEFYKSDENSITKPAYSFKIDDAAYLGNSTAFSRIFIKSKDTSSLQLNALKIYQNLIKFHSKNNDPNALADINIQRLLFVKDHATFDAKEDILLATLQSEINKYVTHQVSGLYEFELANIYYNHGNQYNPISNKSPRWKIKEALEICDATIAKFAESKGAKKSEVLKHQILQQTLQLTTETHVPISKPSKFLVRYNNIKGLNFKVYNLSRSQLLQLNKTYRQDEQLAFIKKHKIFTQWQSTLPNETDYQIHTTEVLLPALNNGYYAVLAIPQSADIETFAFTTLQVTNMALVDKSETTQHVFQVINRTNGQPIENAKVTLNYKRNNTTEDSQFISTNVNGEIRIKKSNDRFWRLDLETNYKNEKAYFDRYSLNRYYDNNDEEEITYRSFIFTDRSIYRPGQTVYFKGIAMTVKDGKSEVFANQSTKIRLFNVNGETVNELALNTNEFGSISGEFILPNDGQTGSYYIDLFAGTYSQTYFSVEEYKRPKFETSFHPVTETFKIDDSITIKGSALAYAGSNITNAKVVYRVHRKVQFPRWYYWYKPWFVSEPQEIAYGEIQTNEKGEFEIVFNALPDDSIEKANLPIFQYEITADVTDLNGETRSATTTVHVGYHALTAEISIENSLDKSKKDHALSIATKNLNGEFVPAKGTIKIYKLQAPNYVLRPRPWKAPDYQEFSKIEFRQLFPNESYGNEYSSTNWEKGTLVFNKEFDSQTSKEVSLGNIKKWNSGQYIILLETKDKFGQVVKDEAKATLMSPNDNTIFDNQLFSISTNKTDYKPGEIASVKIASAGNIVVTIDIEKDQKIVDTQIIKLNNSIKSIDIPVQNDDVGGFVIHYSFAAYNSYQSGVTSINVPYPKTDLEIETLTFRDELQPGTNETWRFKIKGPKGDKVSTELLASMYDASLDQFKPHNWSFIPIQNPIYYSNLRRSAGRTFGTANFRVYNDNRFNTSMPYQGYDQLNWFGFYFGSDYSFKMMRGKASGIQVEAVANEVGEVLNEMVISDDSEGLLNAFAIDTQQTPEKSPPEETEFSGITIRKNLQETAFFFPHLQTDAEGNVSFNFTTPEALTKWKLQLLTHTKSLESATASFETVTQKELMVVPNAPRFLRQGDQITLSTKIANISDKNLSGEAILQLFDALTGTEIDTELNNNNNTKSFEVAANGNTQLSWNLDIPESFQAVQFKVIAKAGDFSDGEQNALPVLSNRMLVTETLPMWIRSEQTKTFTLDKLKNTTSTTLRHHKLTLEMTSNPAWYAVQALPYLMEYPYECNEQTFSRYYANSLASHIAISNPRIQEVFNQWKNSDAILSNLEKNQELKSLLIKETPWLRDAQSETEQKKRIALLFDLNKMNNELQSAIHKLKNNQMASGAWPWFNGGRENRYITQHIITGFGHLKHLNVNSSEVEKSIIEKAISYLDAQFVKEYKDLKKYHKDLDLNKDHLSYTQLHYLYMRSFFTEVDKSKEVQDISNYYYTQIQKYWLSRSLYAKGLMALVIDRMDDKETAMKILKSLKENSITSEELGMYWKDNTNSWYWYQAPIETQSLLIEAFSEIEGNTETIDNLKIWLLKNKQTNRWKTTKATTEAVYALLLQGGDWLSVTDMVDIVLGGEEISPEKIESVKVEAGTGYYKTAWLSSEIQPNMAEVQISKKGNGIAWGSLYWQYFEDLDKITSAETPLKLQKKLFLKKNTDLGEEISEITTNTTLVVGDLVSVRIELRSDRAMEFVHMKDMRAAGLEPVNVLSQYKWQDGLGYYESTKDASTNFFFDYLPKGVYVFEYDLRVNNSGSMSNGITTIQSMYAPEFSSHSEGVRINVE